MGQTIAEKILTERAGCPVKADDFVIAKVDIILLQDGTAPLAIRQFNELGFDKVANPQGTVLFVDHAAPSPRTELSNDHIMMREFARRTGCQFSDVGGGVCHQVICESYVSPGDVLIGADSHSCTAGALCAFATGMGSTDVAVAMALGKTWFRVPRTINIRINGKFQTGVYSKDLMLYLIGKITADGANYMALEFTGSTIDRMIMSERLTLCNMAIEAGAKVGLILSDNVTREYLSERGRPGKFRMVKPDADAVYEKVIDVDVSGLPPVIALPHTVDNVRRIDEVEPVFIQQVFIGTCTNGRIEDLEIVSKIWKNRKKHPLTRVIITPASKDVYSEAAKRGYLEQFAQFGAAITTPGCGACVGVHGGILGDNENCLSTQNRNFSGRMGNPKSAIYLGSPAVAAATAIEGRIADPRKYL
jgi:3-isopropylmalate/(R)-2-methylmalate dehydratase large subunit